MLVEALALAHERLGTSSWCSPAPLAGTSDAGSRSAASRIVHLLAPDRDALAAAYHALDAYVVPSRQEGGPEGVLESLASGVPLVTTRVGQAADLVRMAKTVSWSTWTTSRRSRRASARIAGDPGLVAAFRSAGRATAEATSYAALAPRWWALLDGFARRGDG